MEQSNNTKMLNQMLEQTRDAVQNLAIPLSALAAVQLAAEFYSKNERSELLDKYHSLQLAFQKACDVHNAGLAAKVDAGVRHTNHEAVLRARASQLEFEQAHALIAGLWNVRLALGKTLSHAKMQ